MPSAAALRALAAACCAAGAAHGREQPRLLPRGAEWADEDAPEEPAPPPEKLECLPQISVGPMNVTVCANTSDTCISLVPGTCLPCASPSSTGCTCFCAPRACSGIGPGSLLAATIPNVSGYISGQSEEQADASGIRISFDRMVLGSMFRAKRTDLGDPPGCDRIAESHWCLWLTGIGGQSIVGGSCVPRSCTEHDQAKVRQLAAFVYYAQSAVASATNTTGMTPAQKAELQELIALYGISAAVMATPATLTGGDTGVHCTTGERTGGTRSKEYSDDAGAQGTVAIVAILVAMSLLSSTLLRYKELQTAKVVALQKEEVEPVLTAAPAAAAPPGDEKDGARDPWEKEADDPHVQGGEAPPNDSRADFSAVSESTFAQPEGALAAEVSRGLRASNTGAWADDVHPEPSPRPQKKKKKYDATEGLPCEGLLKAFDVDSHWSALLRIGPSRPTSFLHGWRTWSMAWVIFGHTGFDPTIPGFDNGWEVTKNYQRSFRFVLAYGFSAVDTFFFMSGFLSTYLLVARLRKKGSDVPKLEAKPANTPKFVIQLLLIYLDRYMRLTPVYALCLLISRYVVQYIPQGPLNILANEGAALGPCGEKWYTNLLYVNTVMKEPGSECFGHTWYLGCDMLYVWFFTPFCIMFVYMPRVATACVTACVIVGLGLAIHIGDGTDANFGKAYFRPWNRMTPYLIGILAGFALRASKDWQARVKEVMGSAALRAVLYVTATGLLAGTLVWQWMKYSALPLLAGSTPVAAIAELAGQAHKPYSHAWNRGEAFIYYFGWPAGLFILTIVWAQGHGGLVTKFLGHPIFECVGRLTYGAYLMHPVVLVVMKLSCTSGALPHFNDFWLLSNWTAATLGAFVCSALLHVFVERPAGALWDLATQQQKRK